MEWSTSPQESWSTETWQQETACKRRQIFDGIVLQRFSEFVYFLRIDRDHSVKVADFGLTRDIYQKDYYRQNSRGQIPVKWMAPESLVDHISNEKTDMVRSICTHIQCYDYVYIIFMHVFFMCSGHLE